MKSLLPYKLNALSNGVGPKNRYKRRKAVLGPARVSDSKCLNEAVRNN